MNTLSKFDGKKVIRFYRVVMPGVTILFILIISSIISRPIVFGKVDLDLMLRLAFTIFFYFFYKTLARAIDYFYFPTQKWPYTYVNPNEKGIFIFGSIVNGLVSTIFYTLAIQNFLPFLFDLAIPIAVIFGLIIMLPFLMLSCQPKP